MCGCNDNGLSSGLNYNLQVCPEGETCTEITDAHCVVYSGANLPITGILKGDRLDVMLTKIEAALKALGGTAVSTTTTTA